MSKKVMRQFGYVHTIPSHPYKSKSQGDQAGEQPVLHAVA